MSLGNKPQSNQFGGPMGNTQNNQLGAQNKVPVSPIITKEANEKKKNNIFGSSGDENDSPIISSKKTLKPPTNMPTRPMVE